MANNHAVMISTLMASWDVDSYRLAGIAPSDIDNGTVVTLGDMALGTDPVSGGYEYNVAVASGMKIGKLYIVDTPIPGTGVNIETQVYSDPRYFYNQAGQPISLRKLVDGDHIEVTADAFSTAPTTKGQFCGVTNGKLSQTDNVVVGEPHFVVVAIKTLAIGTDVVPSYVLRYDA